MATLTLTVGTLTATLSANNTKAANVLLAYADAIGAGGTNQEKAQAVLVALAQHMRQEAHRHIHSNVVSTALQEANSTTDQTAWED